MHLTPLPLYHRCIALDAIGDPSSEEERRQYFYQLDIDKSDGIDFEEFLQVCVTCSHYCVSATTVDIIIVVCDLGNSTHLMTQEACCHDNSYDKDSLMIKHLFYEQCSNPVTSPPQPGYMGHVLVGVRFGITQPPLLSFFELLYTSFEVVSVIIPMQP